MPIQVLIIDPHAVTRLGIKQAFSSRSELEIIGEAATIAEGIRIAHDKNPDVAIIDPTAGGDQSIEMLRKLHQELPRLRTLVFTAKDGPEVATQMVALGASGYLIKAADLDEVVVAIQSVHVGRLFISHSHTLRVIPSPHSVNRETACELLSQREREVLGKLADGMTNQQVAEALFLSVKTIETYRSRIMKKHKLADRAELVRFARECLDPCVTESA
ncbi:Transcriptional regulatory protein DevR (DosR) [Planctomycetes bacterium CA13]|uniref:Transcriptional regulatory protein DevR (DosR) n=1 Tax=Novipirellula herctigrandis TaxID=2527986 RepID=A0A5C5YNL3_9BACT|nr:Transcriptional regulatory protein DevR (DosR) [Planctomycetes bacterium CA13]